MSDLRELIAYHEAGHCVIAEVLGHPVAAIRVGVPGKGGVVEFAPLCHADDAARERATRERVIIGLAGRAATEGLGYVGGTGDDADQVWRAARSLTGDDPADALATGGLVLDAYQEARALVAKHWGAIKDIARLLLACGALEGPWVRERVREAIESEQRWKRASDARWAYKPEMEGETA